MVNIESKVAFFSQHVLDQSSMYLPGICWLNSYSVEKFVFNIVGLEGLNSLLDRRQSYQLQIKNNIIFILPFLVNFAASFAVDFTL